MEDKRKVVAKLEDTLRATRAYPDIILRYVDEWKTEKRYCPEMVLVFSNLEDYKKGKVLYKINVTANSELAIIKDVMRYL